MARPSPGERVVAVLSADEQEVRLLGFGVYVGDYPCPIKRQFMEADGSGATVADIARQQIECEDADGRVHGAREDFWVRLDREAVEGGHITPAEAVQRRGVRRAEMIAERTRPMGERIQARVDSILRNPKIELDSGAVCWGIECWWGPESAWPRFAAGRRVVGVERS